jgi:hypothetical protein
MRGEKNIAEVKWGTRLDTCLAAMGGHSIRKTRQIAHDKMIRREKKYAERRLDMINTICN